MFCPDPLFDQHLTWNTSNPNLTHCMRNTLLVFVPCGLLWTTALFWFYLGRSRRIVQGCPWSQTSVLKVLLSITLVMNTIGDYFWTVSKLGHIDAFMSYELSRIVLLSSFLLEIFVQIYEQWLDIIASLPSSVFWLLLAFTMPPVVKYQIGVLAAESSWQGIVLAMTWYPCILTQLAICMLPLCLRHNGMHSEKAPVKNATFFSYLSFSWMNQLIYSGYKLTMTQEQLPQMPASLRPEHCAGKFVMQWRRNTQEKDYSIQLLAEIIRQFKWEMTVVILVGTMYQIILFANPFILKLLINSAYNKEEMWKGMFYIATLLTSTVVGAVIDNFAWYKHLCVTLKLRACVMSLVYRKSLKLSNAANNTFSIGDITNFMSVDAQTITRCMMATANIVYVVIKIALALYFLFQEMGIAALACIGSMLASVSMYVLINNKLYALFADILVEKGKRTKYINDCLVGMNIIKIYGWEIPLTQRIAEARSREVAFLRRVAALHSINEASFLFTPLVVNLSLFITYVAIDSKKLLSAEKIFVSLSLLNIMSLALTDLPVIVANVMRLVVSLKRIGRFLNASELDRNVMASKAAAHNLIEISNGYFSWNGQGDILKDISLKIPKGSFTAMVGEVGSGKTSLLSAILGEVKRTSGNIYVAGSIGYSPQQSWIQNKSVKDNIMFNQAQHRRCKLYYKVLDACTLTTDLNGFAAGDDTEIGENGVNLSGGQKLRVSLARALYADSDIYLLDDPLSAVDAFVGKHLFDNVLSSETGILKEKTRLLVTHNVTYLSQVDTIVVLEDGAISEIGTYNELLCNNGNFSKIIRKFGIKSEWNEESRRIDSSNETSQAESNVDTVVNNDTQASAKGILVKDEAIDVKSVPLSVFIKYINKLGLFLTVCGRSFTLLSYILLAVGSYTLSLWADENHTNLDDQNVYTIKYLGIYTLIGVLGIISFLLGALMYAKSFTKASFTIHKQLIMTLFKCPMSFFHTIPIGRILNLFSSDINAIDVEFPFSLDILSNNIFEIFVIFIVVGFVTPYSIIFVIVLAIIYKMLLSYYIKIYRQLRRLEVVSQSPIFSHFSETLSGATSIRAYQSEHFFMKSFESRVMENMKCHYYRISAQKWLNIRIEILGCIFVAFAALLAILAREQISEGLLGLSITYSFMLIERLKNLCDYLVETESVSISLERIFDHDNNPQEPNWVNESDSKIPLDWPNRGNIVFSNYSARYREGLDLVLNRINFYIASEEKIGICGRTGAGKSTLTLALLRMLDPSEGVILIDGKDISQLGLHLLRSRLTVIPQDPVLFEGSLRFNLDPLQEFSDEKIWTALKQAHLDSHVSLLDKGLDSMVEKGGHNFSVGQRQLTCLARALLRKTKILILDEATAAIDVKTDNLIQLAIRREFKECTVLTIAHRLNTIEDCDRIVVINEGEIIEIGSPRVLLENKMSALSQLQRAHK